MTTAALKTWKVSAATKYRCRNIRAGTGLNEGNQKERRFKEDLLTPEQRQQMRANIRAMRVARREKQQEKRPQTQPQTN